MVITGTKWTQDCKIAHHIWLICNDEIEYHIFPSQKADKQ